VSVHVVSSYVFLHSTTVLLYPYLKYIYIELMSGHYPDFSVIFDNFQRIFHFFLKIPCFTNY
jgi:thiosulfate reductase cytochrome b subunit